MKTASGRIGGLAAAVCLAAGLQAAKADLSFGDLVFIDDFEDPVVTASSPLPGMPGGGIIGGSGFWTAGGTIYPTNGLLAMAVQGNIGATGNLRSSAYSELDFMKLTGLEMLHYEVTGIQLDWGNENAANRLSFGMLLGTPGNTFYSSSNGAVYVHIYSSAAAGAPAGTVRFYLNNDPGESWLFNWAPPEGAAPTAVEMYLNADLYGVVVHYDDGTQRDIFAANPATAPWGDMRLRFECRTFADNLPTFAHVEEIRVTYIPEPGTVPLLGGFGLLLLARRGRGRR